MWNNLCKSVALTDIIIISQSIWEDEIVPKPLDDKNVMIAVHCNLLRALTKFLMPISWTL